MKPFVLRYRSDLTGIRGVAASMVPLYHAFGFSNGIFSGGYLGVDIFFALSGFLITSILIRELTKSQHIDLKHFYLRRAQRLLPALILCIAFVAVVVFINLVPAQTNVSREQIIPALFYFQNYSIIAHGYPVSGMLANTWTLSTEEQFYILWPALLYIGLITANALRIAYICIIAAGVSFLLSVGFAVHGNAGNVISYYSPFTHADGLLLGAATALLAHEGVFPRVRRIHATIAVVVIGILLLLPIFQPVAILLTVTSSLVIIAWASTNEAPTWLAWKPFVDIGKISYALYLWQLPVIMILQTQFQPGLLLFLSSILILAPVTYVSYRFVERPILEWRH